MTWTWTEVLLLFVTSYVGSTLSSFVVSAWRDRRATARALRARRGWEREQERRREINREKAIDEFVRVTTAEGLKPDVDELARRLGVLRVEDQEDT